MLPPSLCLPAVGQGALAIETRSDDAEVIGMLEFLNHDSTRAAVTAERSFLREVEGGCQVPVGVFGQASSNSLLLEAVILSVDGVQVIRDTVSGTWPEAEELGRALAQKMLAAGGREIMAALECM